MGRWDTPFKSTQVGSIDPWTDLQIGDITGAAIRQGAFSQRAQNVVLYVSPTIANLTLRAMYGADVPAPDATLITRWGRDRFAGGSYSHLRPGATGADLDALAAPVDDRLYFAGEATHRHHPATVHGAYLSGLAAADASVRAASR